MRLRALGAGVILIAAAFLAATRVADTREGLIYEVVTLLAGLAGVGLLLYGLVATLSRSRATLPEPRIVTPSRDKVHNAAELVLGVSGLVVVAFLLAGIGVTSGWFWALLGSIILLPMIIGCTYLCFGFARGPHREWKLDLQKLVGHR